MSEVASEQMNYRDPDRVRYRRLAWEYHERTEAYDRTVCSCRVGKVAMPRGSHEYELVRANSKDVLAAIVQRERLNWKQRMELRRWIRSTTLEFQDSLQRKEMTKTPEPEKPKADHAREEESLSEDERRAKAMYGDRALKGPNALDRSIKDWG